MSFSESQIEVQDIEHLAIVAGIIDEMSLLDLFNQLFGTHLGATLLVVRSTI
ncbi:MAG: hypothetical protein HRU34_23395 [Richelia sp.]|nr:hypothetical protein [Richelia sp.]